MQRPRHVSLDDLVAHWCPCVLELECECRDRPPIVRSLVALCEGSPGQQRQTFRTLLARLRCGRCQARPTAIRLREVVFSADRKSWAPGWSVPLPIPAAAPPSGKSNRRGHRVSAGVEYWQIPMETGGPPKTGFEDFPDIW